MLQTYLTKTFSMLNVVGKCTSAMLQWITHYQKLNNHKLQAQSQKRLSFSFYKLCYCINNEFVVRYKKGLSMEVFNVKKLSIVLLVMSTIFLLIGCQDQTETPVPTEETPVVTVYYDVTFNSNGGSAVTVQEIEEGKTATEPADPTKEGFIFGGWYATETLDEGTQFDFTDVISADITLYAKWTEEVHVVTEAEKLAMDIAQFESFKDMTLTGSSLVLPTRGDQGTILTWSTSNQRALTAKGVAIPNPMGGEDKVVTLTLNARNGEARVTETYEITIPAKEASVITSSVTLPYETLTEEYAVLDGNLLTYFVDNGNVPYVDLQDYIMLLDGFIYSDEIEFLWDEITQEEITEDYSATLNFTANTITVPDTSFFSGYVYSTETNYSSGLSYLDEYYLEEGNPVVYDLNAYRFDMIIHEGDYVLPFHLVNLLFGGGSYFNVYYNGDGYKGIYAYGDETTDFMTSSLNSTTIPADVRLATFDAFAFTLDYFYGLKEEQGIETYYDELYKKVSDMLNNVYLTSSRAYSDFVYKVLDELHSSMVYGSVYNDAEGNTPSISLANVGEKTNDWYSVLFAVQDGIEAKWGSEEQIPDFRIISGTKTAVIYLDGFVTKSVDDPETVVDSNDFMRDALDGIYAADPTIENIVIDLSYNTGGNIGALYRVLGYITENPIASHYQDPLTGEKQTYWLEVDTVARTNVNWFFMTSKVTFSAANLMAAIGKYQDVATIIGTTSGGGACSILPIYLPDGSAHQISSLNMISYRVGSDIDGWTYIGIESGVDPDYELAVSDLTNDAAIASLINQINQGTATPYVNPNA